MRRASLDRLRAKIDALEVFNAREAIFLNNRTAAAYAKEHGILGTAGSDAHRASEIGRAWVEMPDFAGRADFLDSLRQGVAHGRLSGSGVHVFTRYDRFRKWLGRKTPSQNRRQSRPPPPPRTRRISTPPRQPDAPPRASDAAR